MEITNISGADVVPRGFSTEATRQEDTQKNKEQPVKENAVPAENNRGTTIDTYA